ncbi:MAG: AmmeMemoRadiSam system radical SAM enzyme, partial [Candidatus Micrarchaeia archaeon]
TIKEMKNIDASRIDLKSINDKFYREVCSATVEPVLNSIELLHKKGHIEIINLIIPTKNDSEEDLRELSKWVAELDKDIPLHFTAFYPANKMLDVPPTPLKTLEKARKIAMEEGVRYVYTGNVPGHEGENTYCYNCGELLIQRYGFSILKYNITSDKKCPKCGKSIKIITELAKSI